MYCIHTYVGTPYNLASYLVCLPLNSIVENERGPRIWIEAAISQIWELQLLNHLNSHIICISVLARPVYVTFR